MNQYGIKCKPELVGLWKVTMAMWVPHYVIRTDTGETIDLKRRIFGKIVDGVVVQLLDDIPAVAHHDGFYPADRRFYRNPSLKTFAINHYKRSFLKFRVVKNLVGRHKQLVDQAVDTFRF